MNIARVLRPEYLMRPRNVFRRLTRRACPENVILPIGTTGGKLRVHGDEYLGLNLRTFGIYDLALTETLFRLTPQGGTVVDVGANIGYTAVVMAMRTGRSGRLIAFEPIATLADELDYNLRLNGIGEPEVLVVRAAASDANTTRRVRVELGTGNDGLFSLERKTDDQSRGLSVSVVAVRLDDALADLDRVDVLKVDVEGHEAGVFAGASELLAAGRIRTVIYEDHHPYPSAAFRAIEGHGMTIWRLNADFRGPYLTPPDGKHRAVFEPNFLATFDPDAVRRVLSPRGWTVF